MGNNHIAYAAFDSEGNCLYVGEGKPDRYKHITSGVSHVYEANRWHFAGKKVIVKILYEGLTKDEAVSKEKEQIDKLKPAWNKCEYGTTTLMKMCKHVTVGIKAFCKKSGRYASRQDHWCKIAKDICKIMSNKGETTITRGQKWCSVELPAGFMSHFGDNTGTYYHVLKAVFDVETKGSAYFVKLKGWDVDDLQ